MRACHNCLHWDVCSVREDDIACGIYKPKEKRNVKPQTNADHIRAMTDEDLAKLLCCTGWRMIEQKECLEWLQQPAEGE